MRVADPGPFAVLRGSVREGVTIEGEAPVVPTTTAVPSPGQAPQNGTPDAGGGAAPAPAAPAGDAGGGEGVDTGAGQPAGQGEVPVAGAEQPAADNPEAGEIPNVFGVPAGGN